MNEPRKEMRYRRAQTAWMAFLAVALLAATTFADDLTPVSETIENGPVQLTTSVDRTTAQIAQRIRLTLKAEAPQGVTLSFPRDRKALGEFEVMDVRDTFDIPVAAGRQWTRVYELESLSSGEHEIPTVSIAFTDRRDGTPKHDVVQSQSIPIRVASVLEDRADPLKFRDIKDVVELPAEPQRSTSWLVALGGGAAIVMLAGLGLVVWRRRREPTADRWALAQLQRLEESDLFRRGDSHEMYFRLTEIFRGYIERRFGIAAPNWTTAEFMNRLRDDTMFQATQKDALGEFLTAADLVKFACDEPSSDELTSAFAKARDFVQQTKARMPSENSRRKEAA